MNQTTAPTRTLVLMRHAAAEGWSPKGDKGRPLSASGRQEAALAGKELAGLGIQHVLSSSSQRTRDTVDSLGLQAPVEFMDALYNCSTETVAHRISEIDDEVGALLVVAHSPGIPSLAAELTWASDPEAADDIQCWFPTAAFSRFEITGSWSQFARTPAAKLVGIRRIGH